MRSTWPRSILRQQYLLRPRASRVSPSVYSACRSPKYASHLVPITLPHEKHRIGMIMVTVLSKSGRSRDTYFASQSHSDSSSTFDKLRYSYTMGVPKVSKNCQKSVRKLSLTKMCQKMVINLSEFCQKTVRCKYLSEIYQKRFGNASDMCQIL